MKKERIILNPSQSLLLLRKLPLKLKKISGSQVTAHCPFHKDKNPSLGIDLQKGVYNCFSCKKRGTIASLAFELTGKGVRSLLDLKKEDNELLTLQSLAFSLQQNYEDPSLVLERYKKTEPPLILKGSFIPWDESYEVLSYLKYRSIPFETALCWGFKYVSYMEIQSRYRKPGEENSSSKIVCVQNRLAVPIYGFNRKILSYEFRALHKEEKPKVLYIAPADYIFRFFSLDTSKPLYVTEGLVDAARLFPYLPNITYLFGSSLTDLKIYLLRKFPQIIIIPDNDIPGYQLILDALEAGLNVKVWEVPSEYEDAGDADFSSSHIKYWLKNTSPSSYTEEEIKEKMEKFKEKGAKVWV
jgi:DNA primase